MSQLREIEKEKTCIEIGCEPFIACGVKCAIKDITSITLVNSLLDNYERILLPTFDVQRCSVKKTDNLEKRSHVI